MQRRSLGFSSRHRGDLLSCLTAQCTVVEPWRGRSPTVGEFMQQGDPAVLSLRPGGGARGSGRLLAPRFVSTSSATTTKTITTASSLAFGSVSSGLAISRAHGRAPTKPGDSLPASWECAQHIRDRLLQLREEFTYSSTCFVF